jgi:hypothetical protein
MSAHRLEWKKRSGGTDSYDYADEANDRFRRHVVASSFVVIVCIAPKETWI